MDRLLNPASAWAHLATRLLRDRPAGRAAPPPVIRLRLQRHATLVVRDPLGRQLRCDSGVLWVTHDGDPKDIVLAAGENYRAERGSRMLVHALLESQVTLSSVGPAFSAACG